MFSCPWNTSQTNSLESPTAPIASNCFPFIGVFSFGKRKKSARTNSGEYGGWGIITVFRFWVKNSRTSDDVWTGALSSWKIYDWFFHNSVCFWRFASRNRCITLLTARTCFMNLWCTRPLQSNKTVGETFIFVWMTCFIIDIFLALLKLVIPQ